MLTRAQLLRCLQASRPDAATLSPTAVEDILTAAEAVLALLEDGADPRRVIQGAALALDIHRSLSTPSTPERAA